ncbi:MAG: hypothetical protein KF857_08970 [Fimbriimonadaceae bacterium]|nr:hypothetical protein [Fimbriimonadaceae bacterium]
MPVSLRDPATRRLTPVGRSVVGAGVLLAAALAYYVLVGFWVADAETREKFQRFDPAAVESVETDVGDGTTVTEAATQRRAVDDLVQALRQARTRQGYRPRKDAPTGHVRFRTKRGAMIENVTVYFPSDALVDRFGPDVDRAVRAVHAAGRPKG